VKPLRNQACGDPKSGQGSTGAIVVVDKGWRPQGDHDNEVTMTYTVLSDGRTPSVASNQWCCSAFLSPDDPPAYRPNASS